MALSTPGVGSGLDVNSIVTQLVALERQPLQKLQQRATTIQSQISSWGKLQSLVDTLRTAAGRLTTASTWSAPTVTSSDNATLTASIAAGSSPSNGRYSVTVGQLAQEHTLASAAVASGSDLRGRVRIELGTYDTASPPAFSARSGSSAIELEFTDAATTLAQVRDAINAANGGVRASILEDSSGQRLVLNSTETGRDRALRVTVSGTPSSGTSGGTTGGTTSGTTGSTAGSGTTSGTGTTAGSDPTAGSGSSLTSGLTGTLSGLSGGGTGTSSGTSSGTTSGTSSGTTSGTTTSTTGSTSPSGLSLLAYDASSSSAMTQSRAAQDAQFTVNGVSMSTSSNQLEGNIPGLRLQLLKVSSTPVDVVVQTDSAGQRKLIEDFVTAYNAVNTQVANDTGYDAATRKGGLFQGDAGALSVRQRLRDMLGQSSSASGTYGRLSEIGLEVMRDGSISINANRLNTAVANPNELTKLLSASGSGSETSKGIMVRLKALTDEITGTEGMLGTKAQSLKSRLDRNQSDQDRLNQRVEATRQRLLRQYQGVDASIARLNGLGNYVAQQFGNRSSG